MNKKYLIFGIVLILSLIIFWDFYKVNESRKIERTFQVKKSVINTDSDLSISEIIKNAKSSDEFRLDYFTNMIAKVKISRHFSFIDYVSPTELDKNNLTELINFFSDSTNFENNETTFDQVDYIIRFYNSDNFLILKMWIGFDSRMVDSEPKMTNIKSGYLSDKGINELKKIIRK